MQPNGFVTHAGSLYAIIESADISCFNPSNKATNGAGRLAVRYSSATGQPISSPCWLVQNQYTLSHLYLETPIGGELCSRELRGALNQLLTRPDIVPFSNDKLINAPVYYAIDGTTPLQELTHAVWHIKKSGLGYWQRFWRDTSGTNNSYVRH